MKGYLSSLLGASLIFLLVISYKAWFSLKDLDKSFSEYVKLHSDVYKRAELEHKVYTFLRDLVPYCEAGLKTGSLKLSHCSHIANSGVSEILASYNIEAPYPIVQPVLFPDLKFVFVNELRGKIGSAVFRVPAGVKVG